jgi:hypothetical protein
MELNRAVVYTIRKSNRSGDRSTTLSRRFSKAWLRCRSLIRRLAVKGVTFRTTLTEETPALTVAFFVAGGRIHARLRAARPRELVQGA